LATCGADGTVKVIALSRKIMEIPKLRQRPKEETLFALSKGDDGALEIRCPPPAPSSPTNLHAKFPDEAIALHKVRWNCSSKNSAWLLFGGASGLVCCIFCPHSETV